MEMNSTVCGKKNKRNQLSSSTNFRFNCICTIPRRYQKTTLEIIVYLFSRSSKSLNMNVTSTDISNAFVDS